MDADGQIAFLCAGDRLSDGNTQDDRGVLSISRIKSDGGITVASGQPAANLYARTAQQGRSDIVLKERTVMDSDVGGANPSYQGYDYQKLVTV